MLIERYITHVCKTDQYRDRSRAIRLQVGLHGIVGEIGSLAAAIKKTILVGDESRTDWNKPTLEIKEELGDAIWYLFSTALVLQSNANIRLLKDDIEHIRREVGDRTERGATIRQALDTLDATKRRQFERQATEFLAKTDITFDDYQKTAYMTARTPNDTLIGVCIAVLWQLGAELLRQTLPDVELKINKRISDRDPKITLGEIAWHLAAIASIYGLSLDDIVAHNVEKSTFRSSNRHATTPLHDDNYPKGEQLPRTMAISFVSVGPGRSRMYYDGMRIGDDLTDNSYNDDRYRFHDVMHCANAAYLGWSPVLRSLLKNKRKSRPKVDEVEDGARAQIVEELLIKAIHNEGMRLGYVGDNRIPRLFPKTAMITSGFIASLRNYVAGLEVYENTEWDWKNAIYHGSEVFHNLCEEEQGTIYVNLTERSLTFDCRVHIGLAGVVRGLGTSHLQSGANADMSLILTDRERAHCDADGETLHRLVAAKRAVLESLGIGSERDGGYYTEFDVTFVDRQSISVKARERVRERMWSRKVIEFEISIKRIHDGFLCTSLALGDPEDLSS